LDDLLAYYGRTASSRNAILAPDCAPVTYGALWGRTNEAIRALRRCGIDRSDRVAVVLPNGPEAAMAVVAVAAGAVCVPMNAGSPADEWQRYFVQLRVAALLTRADMETASRGVAHALGISVIDLAPRPDAGLGPFNVVGPAPRRAARDVPRSADDD